MSFARRTEDQLQILKYDYTGFSYYIRPKCEKHWSKILSKQSKRPFSGIWRDYVLNKFTHFNYLMTRLFVRVKTNLVGSSASLYTFTTRDNRTYPH